MREGQDLEREAQVLAEQADRLISELGVHVSDAETYSKYPLAFRQTVNSYDRLALAQKRTDPVAWERTLVDGRSGDDLMDRLSKVRDAFVRQHIERKTVCFKCGELLYETVTLEGAPRIKSIATEIKTEGNEFFMKCPNCGERTYFRSETSPGGITRLIPWHR